MIAIDNPIWFREKQARAARVRRVRWFGRCSWMGIVSVWFFPLLIGLVCTAGNRYTRTADVVTESAFVSVVLQLLYFCLRSLVAASACIARERDQQTWETLLSTPIGVERLVGGKYTTVIRPLLCEAVCASPLVGLLSVSANHPPMDMTMLCTDIIVLNFASILFFSAVGLYISAVSTSTARAASRAAVVGLIIVAGSWLLDLLLAVLSQAEPSPMFSLINPYAALTSFIAGSCSSHHGGFANPMLGVATVAVYLCAAVALFGLTRARIGRESIR